LQSHERARDRLGRRLERQKALAELETARDVGARHATLEELLAGFERETAVTLALADEPFLERLLVEDETLEQIPAIQRNRSGEGLVALLAEPRREVRGIDLEAA
jgi:hypothetical protein